MRGIGRSLRWLAAVVLAAGFVGGASASAFEAHNFIEPSFGSLKAMNGLAVDLSTGDVYALDSGIPNSSREVQVFGATGGAPAGGGPSSFAGASSPAGRWGGEPQYIGYMGGVAVDNACAQGGLSGGECASFDPSSGAIYVYDTANGVVDRYRLNGSQEYEYVSQLNVGSPGQGIAVDSAGDVYVFGGGGLSEFNPAGELIQTFSVGPFGPKELIPFHSLAVSSNGTIYAQAFVNALSTSVVVEMKRSSLTGAVEGEPMELPGTEHTKAVAFDQATGQLFVDRGSSVEAFDGAHELVSRFGTGVISKSEALAVDEATGEVYVANGTELIDRFGPGLTAALPGVDEPPPSASGVTRTTALISGKVDPENATTAWHLEYVAAGEYEPGAANPYAAGGRTATSMLPPAAVGEGVGPLPLTGLLAGTTYHYRLVAGSEVGTTYGQDHTFTTAPATPPAARTDAASEVTQTSVTLSGVVEPQRLQTSYEFEVGTDTTYGGAKLFGNAGRSAGPEPVSSTLAYLIPGTTYHYRLVAANEDGVTYGQDVTFTTPGVPSPIVQPPTVALIPSPTVAFPSVLGAITKPQGSRKGAKKRRKVGRRKRTPGKKRARGRKR
jgi:hypothetical protein